MGGPFSKYGTRRNRPCGPLPTRLSLFPFLQLTWCPPSSPPFSSSYYLTWSITVEIYSYDMRWLASTATPRTQDPKDSPPKSLTWQKRDGAWTIAPLLWHQISLPSDLHFVQMRCQISYLIKHFSLFAPFGGHFKNEYFYHLAMC